MSLKILLTCEHASARAPDGIPQTMAPRTLLSHRGYDRGTLDVSHKLAQTYHWPLITGEISRLFIDLNRSLDNPSLFSNWSSKLSPQQKDQLIQKYYLPYRNRVQGHIQRELKKGHKVLHLSVHSFTPILRSEVRKTDIGLLYDPRHLLEVSYAKLLHKGFAKTPPHQKAWRIHRNKPYPGTGDGLTTALRTAFPASTYAGIEIEINQRLLRRDLNRTVQRVVESLSCLAY